MCVSFIHPSILTSLLAEVGVAFLVINYCLESAAWIRFKGKHVAWQQSVNRMIKGGGEMGGGEGGGGGGGGIRVSDQCPSILVLAR